MFTLSVVTALVSVAIRTVRVLKKPSASRLPLTQCRAPAPMRITTATVAVNAPMMTSASRPPVGRREYWGSGFTQRASSHVAAPR